MGKPNEITAVSTEFVDADVETSVIDPLTHVRGPADPTALVVQMAFTPVQDDGSRLDPVEADWRPATWLAETVGSGSVYWVRCLVGPGGTGPLAKGRYNVFVRITAPPEVPVIRSDTKLIVS